MLCNSLISPYKGPWNFMFSNNRTHDKLSMGRGTLIRLMINNITNENKHNDYCNFATQCLLLPHTPPVSLQLLNY